MRIVLGSKVLLASPRVSLRAAGPVFSLGVLLTAGMSGCGETHHPWTRVSPAAAADLGAAQAATAPKGATVRRTSGPSTTPHGIEAEWDVETGLEPTVYRQHVTTQIEPQGFKPTETADGQSQFVREYRGDVVVVTLRPESDGRYTVHFSAHPF